MLFQYDYFAFMIVIYIIIIFVGCCLNVLIGVWAYRDAEKRNMDNPAVWLAIVLLGGCIGCIVYLIVRNPIPESPPNNYNPQQSYQDIEQPITASYCPKCGIKLQPGVRFCSECGHQL